MLEIERKFEVSGNTDDWRRQVVKSFSIVQ